MNVGEEFRYLILALQREGNRQFTEALRQIKLTPSQAEVLLVLYRYQPMTLIDLGERLVCEAGSPSRLIKSMVESGLVEKLPNPKDGRAVHLRLTPSATALMPTLIEIDTQFNTGIGQLFDEATFQTINQQLWQVAENTESGQALYRRKNNL
ncbi:MAG: winged helix DNA-binding protein [bacterium]|nr:winged helix DNA-binding protein [bacterium]